MTYWIDLFTGTTWEEFRKAGARISGFSSRMGRVAERIEPNDILLCYLTGVMRWVGALEVITRSSDRSRIWKQAEFPVRFEVRPLVLLTPEHGIPMQELQGKVDFFQGLKDAGRFKGFVRMSPNRFRRAEDGALIIELLRQAEREPIARPVDAKKLARTPLYPVPKRRGKEKEQAVVSVPDMDDATTAVAEPAEIGVQARTSHTEIQYHLLRLGGEMGLNVWVAKNDRSRVHNGVTLGTMLNMVDELPTQFNEATHRTIELIDVLWLKGNSIEAAFEVESTTRSIRVSSE